MKKIVLPFFCLVVLQTSFAQDSSVTASVPVIVHRDFRLDMLAKKEAEINAANANAMKLLARTAMGYRLQVLSTTDREFAFKTRTQLLQTFPDQKVYMSFQAPYLKLKFGNFPTKQEAELYKKQISRMLGGASVYTLSERIEIKPERDLTK